MMNSNMTGKNETYHNETLVQCLVRVVRCKVQAANSSRCWVMRCWGVTCRICSVGLTSAGSASSDIVFASKLLSQRNKCWGRSAFCKEDIQVPVVCTKTGVTHSDSDIRSLVIEVLICAANTTARSVMGQLRGSLLCAALIGFCMIKFQWWMCYSVLCTTLVLLKLEHASVSWNSITTSDSSKLEIIFLPCGREHFFLLAWCSNY
jgi:hypothetical protein